MRIVGAPDKIGKAQGVLFGGFGEVRYIANDGTDLTRELCVERCTIHIGPNDYVTATLEVMLSGVDMAGIVPVLREHREVAVQTEPKKPDGDV